MLGTKAVVCFKLMYSVPRLLSDISTTTYPHLSPSQHMSGVRSRLREHFSGFAGSRVIEIMDVDTANNYGREQSQMEDKLEDLHCQVAAPSISSR